MVTDGSDLPFGGGRWRKASAAPSGFARLEYLDIVDSTNRVVVDRARDGEPEGLVVVADHQLAGRGRRGRDWIDEPGSSLLASILFRPRLGPADLGIVPIVVALAACDALRDVAGVAARLKWPNDLIVGEAKVAGILSEVAEGAVVVGIGVNLVLPHGARTLPTPATSVSDAAGRRPDRGALLAALVDGVGARYALVDDREGRARIMDAYRAASATLGAAVRAELEGTVLVGTAVAITESGRLVVRTAAGDRTVDAADVVHLRRDSTRPRGAADHYPKGL